MEKSKPKPKKNIITLRVSDPDLKAIKENAERTQGGNVSRYLLYLHRQNKVTK